LCVEQCYIFCIHQILKKKWEYISFSRRRVQVNQDGLKLNGKHQLLFYADDVNTVGRNLNQHTIKKNTEALIIASKESGLEVNADTTKYMVMT